MGLLSKKMMQVQLHSDHVDLVAVVEIVSDGLWCDMIHCLWLRCMIVYDIVILTACDNVTGMSSWQLLASIHLFHFIL